MNEERKWLGRWINDGNTMDTPTSQNNNAPYLRKTFICERKTRKASVFLCGLGWHVLYVNGRKADDRVLAPTVSQFDKHVGYIEYDVTELLKKGKFPAGAVETLKKLADWNKVNGEAVTGCGRSEFQAPYGCCYTQKGSTLYCYMLVASMGDLILPGLRDKVEKITLLRTGKNVDIIMPWGYELLKKDDLRIRPTNAQAGDVLKIELKA